MLKGEYTSVLGVSTRDEFRDEVIRFTHRIGFEMVSAITVIEHGLGDTEFIAVDNTPVEFSDAYFDPGDRRRDPVMQHLKRQSVPIIWDQDTYVESGSGELWEHQAKFGYCTGIAMALHLPDGKHFMFGVDREEALPVDADALQRLVADLQLFAVHAPRQCGQAAGSPITPARTSGIDPAGAGDLALDDGWQDRVGGWGSAWYQ